MIETDDVEQRGRREEEEEEEEDIKKGRKGLNVLNYKVQGEIRKEKKGGGGDKRVKRCWEEKTTDKEVETQAQLQWTGSKAEADASN